VSTIVNPAADRSMVMESRPVAGPPRREVNAMNTIQRRTGATAALVLVVCALGACGSEKAADHGPVPVSNQGSPRAEAPADAVERFVDDARAHRAGPIGHPARPGHGSRPVSRRPIPLPGQTE
jgi:hypothetical protein